MKNALKYAIISFIVVTLSMFTVGIGYTYYVLNDRPTEAKCIANLNETLAGLLTIKVKDKDVVLATEYSPIDLKDFDKVGNFAKEQVHKCKTDFTYIMPQEKLQEYKAIIGVR